MLDVYRTIYHWMVTIGRNWWSTQYPPIELSRLVRKMEEEEEVEEEEAGKEEVEEEEVGKEEVERWKRQT